MMDRNRQCLVCMECAGFSDAWDEDCLRCNNCGCLPYTEVNSIVLDHRKEYAERHKRREKPFCVGEHCACLAGEEKCSGDPDRFPEDEDVQYEVK